MEDFTALNSVTALYKVTFDIQYRNGNKKKFVHLTCNNPANQKKKHFQSTQNPLRVM